MLCNLSMSVSPVLSSGQSVGSAGVGIAEGRFMLDSRAAESYFGKWWHEGSGNDPGDLWTGTVAQGVNGCI